MGRGHERVELYLYSPYGPYSLYRALVPVQGCTVPLLVMTKRMLLGVLKITMGLLTRHCNLKGHLLKLELVDSPDAGTNLKQPRMFFVIVRHWEY